MLTPWGAGLGSHCPITLHALSLRTFAATFLLLAAAFFAAARTLSVSSEPVPPPWPPSTAAPSPSCGRAGSMALNSAPSLLKLTCYFSAGTKSPAHLWVLLIVGRQGVGVSEQLRAQRHGNTIG